MILTHCVKSLPRFDAVGWHRSFRSKGLYPARAVPYSKVMSKTAATKSDYTTYPVAAGAYGKRGQLLTKASLTHSWRESDDTVLCGKVKPDSILVDDCMTSEGEQPTCPHCVARLAKLV